MLIYLVLAFAAPRVRCSAVAAAAVVLCVLVELFQLTPWPAQWAIQWPPLHLVFGTTFNPWDLPAYAAGAAAAWCADAAVQLIASRKLAGTVPGVRISGSEPEQ